MVLMFVYFYSVGSYFLLAPLHWTSNRPLGYMLSVALFVSGIFVLTLVFDRVYPKLVDKRISQGKPGSPGLLVVVLKICALIFDIIVSVVAAVLATFYMFGHKTGTGFSISGWTDVLPVLLVFFYFFLMNQYAGGTLGKRIFGIR